MQGNSGVEKWGRGGRRERGEGVSISFLENIEVPILLMQSKVGILLWERTDGRNRLNKNSLEDRIEDSLDYRGQDTGIQKKIVKVKDIEDRIQGYRKRL